MTNKNKPARTPSYADASEMLQKAAKAMYRAEVETLGYRVGSPAFPKFKNLSEWSKNAYVAAAQRVVLAYLRGAR